MKRRSVRQIMLWVLVTALGPVGAAGPGRVQLDPGADISSVPAPASQPAPPADPLPAPPSGLLQADLLVGPGGWLPLGLASVERRIEVMTGEVLVVLRGERVVILAGATHVLPAGAALELVNIGGDPARVRITAASSP